MSTSGVVARADNFVSSMDGWGQERAKEYKLGSRSSTNGSK